MTNQTATITEKYGNKRTYTVTKTHKDWICVNSIKRTMLTKWIWTAEDGTEWTKMCGEWRKVVDRKHWRTGTVVGKEASENYMDIAVSA